MIYILLKGKEVFGEKVEKAKIQLILNTLFENPSFIIKDLTYEGWKIFLELSIPKLHDRIMVAICKQEQVTAIITKDEEIIKSSLLETIW
jgi:predicted nucleic acid-binding protein